LPIRVAISGSAVADYPASVFIHERFVFLQMRKAGSTFLGDALQRELPSGGLSPHGKHAPWAKIPPDARHRPVLVFIRNPWDWYVSWYHFNLERGGTPNGYWKAISEGGRLNFAQTVRKAVTISAAIMGADLYSTLFRNLVGDGLDSQLLTVGRFESLFDDFVTFLTTAGVELGDEAIARIQAAAPINASDRGAYRHYYDDKLRDIVGDSCGPFIDRFGYEF
jgi:hypothetical protein